MNESSFNFHSSSLIFLPAPSGDVPTFGSLVRPLKTFAADAPNTVLLQKSSLVYNPLHTYFQPSNGW